jgi:hypothetical protein
MTSILVVLVFLLLAVAMLALHVEHRYRLLNDLIVESSVNEVLLVNALREASKAGASAIAAELGDRLGTLSRDQEEIRTHLRTATARLGNLDVSLALVPRAIEAARTLLDEKFKEWEERQIPPEGQEIGATAMSRIRSVREDIRAKEEESLKKFAESMKIPGAREPLIRVRSGD